jgi:hypothetical protein
LRKVAYREDRPRLGDLQVSRASSLDRAKTSRRCAGSKRLKAPAPIGSPVR